MAIGTYAELQTAVASFLHRDDLTSTIPDFIRLAEADLQVRAKLSEWDASATVAMTSGSGALPSDFGHAQSVILPEDWVLQHLPAAQYDAVAVGGDTGDPEWFTIRGSTLQVFPLYTGDLTLKYAARFTPLSTTATTNSLLTLFPDAYLNGSLAQAANWTQDDAALTKYSALFEASVRRIRTYMLDHRYPDGLQMRAA